MRQITIFFMLFLSLPSTRAIAMDNAMIACHCEGDGWTSELMITDFGKASLKVQKKGSLASICEMKIRTFDYAEQAQVPDVSFVFDRQHCVRSLGPKLERELLSRIVLRIELLQQKKGKSHKGILHWLRYSQSHDCVTVSYDQASVKRAFFGWKKGIWPN